MEQLLLDLVPQLEPDWGGASDDEIAQIEALAGRELPAFYRWFLHRLGRDMGPLRYRSLDFSCRGILAAYADGSIERDRRFLLIAYDSDPIYPNHAFYDLDRPARDDAMVMSGEDCDEEDLQPSFESLREMLAWGTLFEHGVRKHPQRCRGMFEHPTGNARTELDSVLPQLGFTSVVPTGLHCGVFRGSGIDMVSRSTPGKNPHLQSFTIGAADTTTIRSVLGQVTTQTKLELEIGEWDPTP